MKATSEREKQSLLMNHKSRRATFVSLESHEIEKFKYNHCLRVSKYLDNKFIATKRFCNKIIQGLRLQLNKIDFKAVKYDLSAWMIEALIEGLIINFAVWALLGWRFNPFTVLAWGIVVKELLSIYWRFRINGPTTTIPQKNK